MFFFKVQKQIFLRNVDLAFRRPFCFSGLRSPCHCLLQQWWLISVSTIRGECTNKSVKVWCFSKPPNLGPPPPLVWPLYGNISAPIFSSGSNFCWVKFYTWFQPKCFSFCSGILSFFCHYWVPSVTFKAVLIAIDMPKTFLKYLDFYVIKCYSCCNGSVMFVWSCIILWYILGKMYQNVERLK